MHLPFRDFSPARVYPRSAGRRVTDNSLTAY